MKDLGLVYSLFAQSELDKSSSSAIFSLLLPRNFPSLPFLFHIRNFPSSSFYKQQALLSVAVLYPIPLPSYDFTTFLLLSADIEAFGVVLPLTFAIPQLVSRFGILFA
jgi:hypothetical protein